MARPRLADRDAHEVLVAHLNAEGIPAATKQVVPTQPEPLPEPRLMMPRPSISTLRRYEGVQQVSSQALQDLLQLTADLCGATRCVVGLLDEQGAMFRTAFGVPAAEVARFVPLWLHVLAGGAPVVRDVRAQDPLAAMPDLGAQAFLGVPLLGPAGQPIGALAVCADLPHDFSDREEGIARALGRQIVALLQLKDGVAHVRERHFQEHTALKTLHGVLRAALTVGIVATDNAGTITHFNAGAEQLFGVGAEDVVHRASAASLFAPDDLATCLHTPAPTFEALAAHCRASSPHEQECRIRRGTAIHDVTVSAAPIYDEEQALSGYVFVVRDVSEQRAAARMRDEFISSMSHELRTPLTAILGALNLIAGGVAGTPPEGVVELVRIAQDNSGRLLRLVNDILDLQKIEAGVFELDLTPHDLHAVVSHAVDLASPLCTPRALSVALERHSTSPLIVRADFDRLVQVVLNLLSNAVKFSPHGTTIEVSVVEHDGHGRIVVRDHGPGIPLDFHSRVFARFAQASADNPHGGTGLGLSIVRSLVELHRGHVSFESVLGSGTTFQVALPLLGEDEKEAPQPS